MEGNTMNLSSKGSLDNDILMVSSSPHLRSDESTKKIMLDVIIALIPAVIGSVYFFGLNALKLILISVAAAVLSEYLIQKLFKKEVTINDYSAIITGTLLALTLPASAPWWIPIMGSVFAIVVVKQFFGGIGQNFMNPALAARAFLVVSWPAIMTNYTDGVSGATPVSLLKEGAGASQLPEILDMFIGNVGGSLGETSAILLLIGGAYLIIRKTINWKTPIVYIGTTAAMLLILGVETQLILPHILGGGIILGAFFMLTDYATTPVTPWGQIIAAIGAGLLTALIRIKGATPEGVAYSILLMNVATPLIEKFTAPRIFGRSK